MDATPRSLLERLAGSPDETAWRRLTAIYEPFIRRWLLQAGVPEADAADLTQDVFAALVKDIARFEHNGRTGAFRTWLRIMVVNRLRGHWRDRPRDTPLPADLTEAEGELSRRWDREHDSHVVRELLAAIEGEFSPQTWAAFRRQVLDEAKAADVAAELGVTPNAVLVAKSRVLRRLRQEAEGLVDEL